MTVDEYWQAFRDWRGWEKAYPAAGDQYVMNAPNGTDFRIPDPHKLDADGRAAAFEFVKYDQELQDRVIPS